VAPTAEDPWARWGSAAIGGPPGAHAGRHPRLTALVAGLAVCVATFGVGVLHLAPCAGGAWWDPPGQYVNQCWSQHPYDYATGGLAERTPPLSDGSGRFEPFTESPGIAVAAYGAALVASAVSGWPDVGPRGSRPVEEVGARPSIRAEAVTYTGVVAIGLLLSALLTVGLLTRTHRPRPWDAMAFAAAPVLILTGLMGWDLLSVALATGALWAWSNGRPQLAGLLAGVGTATAWWPLTVVLAGVLLCVRAREGGAAVRLLAATAAGFAAVVLPAYLLAPEGIRDWLEAAGTVDEVGDGSTWQLAVFGGVEPPVHWLEPAALALLLVAVTALVLLAPRRPRLPQVALVVLVGALLVHSTHDPQTVLWVLPLAALARPRWRDLVLWQAAEVLYVLALGWHLQGYTAPDSGTDLVFTLALTTRFAAELTLLLLVVRDVLQPWRDPVRASGRLDDPAGGILDEAAAR
jgi:uncharacterized membrane protein